MKILVFGLGKSGSAVLDLIHEKTIVFDLTLQNIDHLKKSNREFYFCDFPNVEYDLVIKNPGISYEILSQYVKLDVPIITEMQYSMNYNQKPFYIGITGSNGKTTTCSLLYEMMKSTFNSSLYLGGNIGIPLSSLVSSLDANSIVIIEVSSFQLKTYNYQSKFFDIAAITNFSQAHLDYHGTVEDYFLSKLNILNGCQNIYLNQDNELLYSYTKGYKNATFFSKKSVKDGFLYVNDLNIIAIDDIVLKGEHNLENIILCVNIALKMGVDVLEIQKVLSTFSGVKHRMSFVLEDEFSKFYNDSKATNIESTLTALKSFADGVTLICGGLDRMQDFSPLLNYKNVIKNVFCYGENSLKIYNFFKEFNVEVVKCSDLKDVFNYRESFFENVLFSPFSASWDQFSNFEERGNLFESLVRGEV